MSHVLRDLEQQIRLTIPLLERQYQKTPASMLKLIIMRYKTAADRLAGCKNDRVDGKSLYIIGGVRAYLDSASDYMNPMLEEMYKAEQLFAQAFNQR